MEEKQRGPVKLKGNEFETVLNFTKLLSKEIYSEQQPKY